MNALAVCVALGALSAGGQEASADWVERLAEELGLDSPGRTLEKARRYAEARAGEIRHAIETTGCEVRDCEERVELVNALEQEAWEQGEGLGFELVLLEWSLEVEHWDRAAYHLGYALLVDDVATLRWLDESGLGSPRLFEHTQASWESCPYTSGSSCGLTYHFDYDPCTFVQLLCLARLEDDEAIRKTTRPFLRYGPQSLHASRIIGVDVSRRLACGERAGLLAELAALSDGPGADQSVSIALAYLNAADLWEGGRREELADWIRRFEDPDGWMHPRDLLAFVASLAGG